MSFQDPFVTPENRGTVKRVATIMGREMIGLPVKAPKTTYERVYVLPLLTISMGKGTGVVTSVPSDAPDDYAALRDWQKDEKLRNKYSITEEMVVPFEVIPIINIPGMGDKAAVYMCEKLKIKSQNDKNKLVKAKEETYKKGFYEGVMLVGEEDGVKGMKVCDAKNVCKAKMCKEKEAIAYYEPEESVMSRSGQECIVAHLDQWYLKYGEEEWCNSVKDHVKNNFETYTTATCNKFNETLDWLREWACSRNFGLGTLVPWDEQFVIESLSDSTIYMAYYTISHLLQGRENDRDYVGAGGSPLGIKPEQLVPAVFDYIFLNKEYPADCGIEESKLAKMRESFRYWYPMNLRVSGRDLIQNHLTMCLYNHAAIWKDSPELWPQAFFCNGFVEVDGEKMSKNVGNFIMLEEAICGHRTFNLKNKEIVVGWTADCTRLALGVAGDGLEGANFSCETADRTILRLTNELDWVEKVMKPENREKFRTNQKDEFNFFERAFDAQMELAVEKTMNAYDSMKYQEVIKHGFYDFQGFRDTYRDACEKDGIPLNIHLIDKFLEIAAIIMCPIIPHFCEKLWRDYLKKDGFVVQAAWPSFQSTPDYAFVRSVDFINETARNVRVKVSKMITKKKVKEVKSVTLHLSNSFPVYQQKILKFLAAEIDPKTKKIPDNVMSKVKDLSKTDEDLKKNMKHVMKTCANAKSAYEKEGLVALELGVPFDQEKILLERKSYLIQAMQLENFNVVVHESDDVAKPGNPRIELD